MELRDNVKECVAGPIDTSGPQADSAVVLSIINHQISLEGDKQLKFSTENEISLKTITENLQKICNGETIKDYPCPMQFLYAYSLFPVYYDSYLSFTITQKMNKADPQALNQLYMNLGKLALISAKAELLKRHMANPASFLFFIKLSNSF